MLLKLVKPKNTDDNYITNIDTWDANNGKITT